MSAADSPSTSKQHTLRLVLAESTVHYSGINGIHFNRFVARKFLGGPGGLPLKDAVEGRFSESIRLSDVNLILKTYLDDYEDGRNKTAALISSKFEWIERLDTIDPGQIVVVAFVQDDTTKEILQAAVVSARNYARN